MILLDMQYFVNASNNKSLVVTAAGSQSFDLEDIVEVHKGVGRTRQKRQATLRVAARICKALRLLMGGVLGFMRCVVLRAISVSRLIRG